MDATQCRQRFRRCLEGETIGYPISVFDPISARIAEHLGAHLGILGGSIASASTLAAPDVMVLTLSELADRVYRITHAADISLLVDADHGYGNSLNVMRVIRDLESAGASAISIEDTELPTGFGKIKPATVSVQEMVGKLRGAIAARQDPNLVIVARTAALKQDPLFEATNRAASYAETGVDALMLIGATEPKQVEAMRAATNLPLILGSTNDDLTSEKLLLTLGVHMVLRGHQPYFVAMRALYDAMKHITDGGSITDLKSSAATKELQDIVLRSRDYDQWQQDYLT